MLNNFTHFDFYRLTFFCTRQDSNPKPSTSNITYLTTGPLDSLYLCTFMTTKYKRNPRKGEKVSLYPRRISIFCLVFFYPFSSFGSSYFHSN